MWEIGFKKVPVAKILCGDYNPGDPDGFVEAVPVQSSSGGH